MRYLNEYSWIEFFFLDSLDSIANVCFKLIACSFMEILMILKTGGGLEFLFPKQNHIFLMCLCTRHKAQENMVIHSVSEKQWKLSSAGFFYEVGVKE